MQPTGSLALPLTILSLTILAAATPTPTTDGIGNGSSGPCSSTPQCCAALMPANSTAGSALLGALGGAVEDLTSLVGLACAPAVSPACEAHAAPVCCAGEKALAGILSLGCLPLPIPL